MDIIIIIGAVFVAGFAGYVFRMAIESLVGKGIIITKQHPLAMIPGSVKYLFGFAILLFVMAIVTLATIR